MEIRELAVRDAYEITPKQHGDDRGVFLEWFKRDAFVKAVGHPLRLVQANCSVSALGTLRGIHFAQVPPSQAKYVTCVRGSGLDVVVDIREGSPTYGAWDAVRLDETDRRAVYVAEGLGHAFLALSDDSTLVYLCSAGYQPDREHGLNPLDPAIGIDWPADISPLLSPTDRSAPTLAGARSQGILPSYDKCQRYYDELRRRAAEPSEG